MYPSAIDPTAEQLDSLDCGWLSLYYLLRLEGYPAAATEALKDFVSLASRRRSLGEIRELARKLGMSLVGVKLPSGPRAPDRPSLCFMNRLPHGHFIVIRPVGHSGRLVQVFDGIDAPVVMDAATLYASREWTGLALVPERPNWPARIAGAITVASVLALVATILVPRLRRKPRALAGTSPTAS
jgi:ABC-type bacteriocin/lantibiotic exporter with double-glycine peptidase domain